jgi:peptidoglycan/LPS O-acetylase OafA/YrhL
MQLPLAQSAEDGKNENIQHLRGIAILCVVFHHFTWLQPAVPPILWEAWSGVDLFFAISGYVVSLSLSRTLKPATAASSLGQRLSQNATAIRSFLTRRFWRIVPPLLAALSLTALLTLFLSITTWRHFLVEVLAALSMTYNYVVYGGGPFVLDVLWSLAVEMQFYLLLPIFLVAFFTRRQRLIAAGAVFVLVGLVVRPIHVHVFTTASQNWLAVRNATHCRLDALAAGVFVFALLSDPRTAQAVRNLSTITIRFVAFFCIALLLGIPAATSIEFSHTFGFSLLAAASAGLVLVAAARGFLVIPLSPLRAMLRYAGERSFSIYLIHRLAPVAFSAAFPRVVAGAHAPGNFGFRMWVIECVAIVVGTWSTAELMYQFVEKPSMKAGQYWARRKESREIGHSVSVTPHFEPITLDETLR